MPVSLDSSRSGHVRDESATTPIRTLPSQILERSVDVLPLD